jgi:hypothetical protein
MQRTPGFLTRSLLAVAVVTAAACGGAEPSTDPSAMSAQSASASAGGGGGSPGKKGGGSTGTAVAMSVTPSTVALNGTVTVALTPGSIAGKQIFINWMCNQSGQDVASGRSWELNYAVGNESGYAWVTDHFEWTFTVFASPVFAAGPATCWAKGLLYTSKSGYQVVGQVNFTVQ